jgi:hypothetical protein
MGHQRTDLFTENEVAVVTDELDGFTAVPYSLFFRFHGLDSGWFRLTTNLRLSLSAWVGTRSIAMHYRPAQGNAYIHTLTGLD